MSEPQPQDLVAIAHLYACYAQALDEKRYALLDGVFTPGAELLYRVGDHEFRCTGTEAPKAFREFLDLCYWTHHLIAAPSVEIDGDGAHASARVVANHLQRKSDGRISRWVAWGSYHDRLERRDSSWRIVERTCVCEEEGAFSADDVIRYPDAVWTTELPLQLS